MRLALIGFGAALFALYAMRDNIPLVCDFLAAFQARSEAIFSSAFTFLSIFWAAMLTIWSLLKSRATRYIERLTDNAIFQDFMRSLEVRLVIGLVSIILSFALYIANPTLIAPWPAFALAVWLFLVGASMFLLFDSLLTARVVLD